MGRKTSKTVLSLIVILVSASCARSPQPIAYECPSVKLPPHPISYVATLNDKSKPDDIIKAWVATSVSYRDWHDAVETQVSR